MAVYVSSFFLPSNNNKFFLLEDIYVKGGFQIRPSIAERNSILSINRKPGMLVYTLAEAKTWRLGTDLTTWVEETSGQGPSGPAGTNGNVWRSGTGIPANTLGLNNDYYLDLATGDVYQKTSDAYVKQGNIKGAPGSNGIDGVSTTWRSGSTVPANSLGNNGDLYLNTTTYDVYQKSSGSYAIITNIKGATGATGQSGATGATGAAGSIWNSGSGSPASSLGANGDYYLDIVTGDVYKKASGAYSIVANIKGATGPTGTPNVWRSGSGTPSSILGLNNDYYLDTTNGDVYLKTSGAYNIVTNIKGQTSVWNSGSGAPSNSLGNNGDLYLNTSTGDVYQKSSGAYSVVCNIKGPQGAAGTAGTPGAKGSDGATWRQGTVAPANSLGLDNDFYLDTITSNIYQKISGNYSLIGNFKGLQGTAGTPANAWRTGAGAPSNTLGSDLDFYLNTSTGDVYQRTSGVYSVVCNIKGPQGIQGTQGATGATGATGQTGATGATGADGSVWRTGSTAPSNSLGKDGDLYLNISTSDVYQRTAGVYSSICNIKGSQGDQGPAGSTAAHAATHAKNGSDPISPTAIGALDVTLGGTVTGSTTFTNTTHLNGNTVASYLTWANSAVDSNLPSAAGLDGTVIYGKTSKKLYYSDGTSWVGLRNDNIVIPYDFGFFLPGNLSSGSTVVGSYLATRQISLPLNLTGSLAKCKTVPSASTTYTLSINSTAVGTLTFSGGSTIGVFNFATAKTLQVGDLFEITTPSTPDSNIRDISVSVVGFAVATQGTM